MSPFTITIIIGFILMIISIALSPGGFFLFNPLFMFGSLIFFIGIAAHLRNWWTRGYD